MFKVFNRFSVSLITSLFFLFLAGLNSPVLAEQFPANCSGRFQNWATSAIYPKQPNLGEAFDITVNFTKNADTSTIYYVKLTHFGTQILGTNRLNADARSSESGIDPATNIGTFHIPASGFGSNTSQIGSFRVTLMGGTNRGIGTQDVICELGNMNFADKSLNTASCNLKMPDNVKQGEPFRFIVEKNDVPGTDFITYFIKLSSINPNSLPRGASRVYLDSTTNNLTNFIPIISGVGAFLRDDTAQREFAFKYPISAYFNPPPQTGTFSIIPLSNNTNSAVPPNLGWVQINYNNSGAIPGLPDFSNRLEAGDFVAITEVQKKLDSTIIYSKLVSYCSAHNFKVGGEPTTPDDQWTSGTPISRPGEGGVIGGGELVTETCLERREKDKSNPKTVECAEAKAKPCGENNLGIQTAIGCIHTSPAGFTKDFLRFIVGIGGGFAFLMMILGAFQMLTSAGNPEALQAGRERLTSAIVGLLFVIFAVLLMQIIGVDLLGLPGLTR